MKLTESSLALAALASLSAAAQNSLVVDEAPAFVRPYVLPRYKGHAVLLTPSQVIRFSVTTNSSGGAFSLVQHNGKVSGYTSARPHTHHNTHEHFYCSRGRVELWAKKNVTDSSHEARVATPGDYGNAPPGTIHTFQMTDPDSQLTHIFSPGGFEHLFDAFSLGSFDSALLGSPYVPITADADPFGPVTNSTLATLAALDLYPASADVYIPRRDFVNGTAGAPGLNWHNGTNDLPESTDEPYFVAKDYGAKFLNVQPGLGYKIVQPLATPTQTAGNLTVGTVILSPKLANETATKAKLPHHFALQLDEGQLALSVDGYDPVFLLAGDVAFIPSGTDFEYSATVPFTKFLYINAGPRGLDYDLLQNSIPWDFPAYPPYPGFTT
ncbi:RmlC-like cupin [Thozetella sp. PMI_491]|nr:RmlC-like cupin [Thozetella sp. PMI_491]